jgi:hypothetical protein
MRIGRERKRIQMRLDATCAAEIVVVAPHAADIARALKDHEIVDAVALELDRRSQPAEAAANDRHL